MDLNSVRIAVMLLALGAYLTIVLWAYAPRRREPLDAEARRILDEIEP